MLVKPTLIIPDVTAIDLTWLKAQGVEGIIFDLDNTIMAPHAGFLEDNIKSWLENVQDAGFRSIVVSNNKKMVYMQEVEKVLNFPVIGNAGKPRRKYLRQALSMLNLTPDQVVVIGDRPLTDIWGGQRLGAHTILVDPLTKAIEPPMIQFLRRLERMFVIESGTFT